MNTKNIDHHIYTNRFTQVYYNDIPRKKKKPRKHEDGIMAITSFFLSYPHTLPLPKILVNMKKPKQT